MNESSLWSPRRRRMVLRAAWLALVAGGAAIPRRAASQTSDSLYSYQGPIVISNASVIDGRGNRPLRGQDVYLSEGRITRVGPHRSFPLAPGAKLIDGTGLTVMPGLIDAHSHLDLSTGVNGPEVTKWLYRMLYAGVTTAFDIGSDLDMGTTVRDEVAAGKRVGPRFITVGTVFDGPNERGEAGTGIVNNRAELVALMNRHQEKHVEMLKAYVALPATRLGIMADEAHKRGMRVVVDASGFIGSSGHTLTGIDGYAHMPWHVPAISESDMQVMKDRGVFVISTVAIVEWVIPGRNRHINRPESIRNNKLMQEIYSKPELDQWVDAALIGKAVKGFNDAIRVAYGDWFMSNWDQRSDWAMNNTKRLLAYGVITGMGTDAVRAVPGEPMHPMGESMHYELGLWAKAGIPPLKAIQAATSTNARILKLDRTTGAVAAGLAADLLVVKGDPSVDMSATRNIQLVVSGGRIVNREALSRVLTSGNASR